MKTICANIAPARFHYDFPQNKEEILFFDIETTGLSPKTSSLYLIGVLFFSKEEDCFTELQWFAERNKDEKAVLTAFLDFLESYSYLYHFNGRTFDIPYILEKCSRHALSLSEHTKGILLDDTGSFSIDILARTRKLKRFLSLRKCSQKALEEYLGIFREDTFSGGELISVYAEYTQMRLLAPEKADALEKTLLLHNFEDVEMMLSVCSLLQYETLLQGIPYEDMKITLSSRDNSPKNTDEKELPKNSFQERILISLPSAVTFPKEIRKTSCYPKHSKSVSADSEKTKPASSAGSGYTNELPMAELQIKGNELLFSFPVIRDTLKYFFEDYKNYFYLPAEDMAVHKSISSFADSTHRKKATKETCYVKKEGCFLPSLAPVKRKKEKNATLFFKEYGDRPAYYELPKDYDTNTAFWNDFLKEQIPFFYK